MTATTATPSDQPLEMPAALTELSSLLSSLRRRVGLILLFALVGAGIAYSD